MGKKKGSRKAQKEAQRVEDSLVADKMFRQYLALSEYWVNGLPREIIGSLVVDKHLLVFQNAWMMISLPVPIDERRHQALTYPLIMAHLNNGVFSQHDRERVDAELVFWMEYRGMETSVWENMESKSIPGWRDILNTAKEFPGLAPYLAVGIRDSKYMLRCVENGIDPDMALEMSRSAAGA